MASSASEQPVSRTRGAGSALALPRLGDPRHYIFLALLTTLALIVVYMVRPVVRVDIGGDYDSAFLRDFNGREIDAAAASETIPWPAGQETLTVPGHRSGVWIATLRAAPGQPDDILESAAVAVNEVRIDMPRHTASSVLATIPPDLTNADQLTFSLVSPLVGGALPPRDIVGEIVLAPARTYRWSTDESTIQLPNLGRGAWTVSMNIVTSHPNGQPLNAQVFANDTLIATLPERNDSRRVHLLVPPDLVRDGSLDLTLRSNTFVDPRPLGIFISELTVVPAGNPAFATAIPPLGGLGLALVAVVGFYASLALILGGTPAARSSRWPNPGMWAAFGVAAAIILGAWALTAYRFPSSFMLPRLAWLAVCSVVLVLLTRPFTAWLFRVAGVPLDETPGAPRPAGSIFLNLLLLFVFVSFWLKAIGIIYPYFVAIDVHWHMTRAQWILDGQLPKLYGTNSPLNESTMPTAEWGANRPVIPYSPWFHMFATIFAFMPVSMSMAANLFSILIDSSRIILIALIARKAGLSARVALIAALTYAVLPVAYMLHSWGNVPTAFGLWQTLLANTLIFVFWERLHERKIMALISFVLLLTLLMYTVTGVFMGVFLVTLTILVWLNGMRGGEWAALRRSLGALWIAAGVAIGLSLLIYYGQYIPPIIERTVPYLGTVFTKGPESVGVERPPFGQYLWGFVPHLDYRIWPGDYLYYGIGIPMLFTVPGFIALRRRPMVWLIFAAWFVVAVLFMFAGYRISMVDKQLFYLLPVMCVCWAVYAERYWMRGVAGRVFVTSVFVLSLVSAIALWLQRIATSPVVG